jgi:hypothetical protein
MAEGKTLHWEKSLSYGHNVHHKIECTKYVCIHVLIWNWAWALNMRAAMGIETVSGGLIKYLMVTASFFSFLKRTVFFSERVNVCFEAFISVCWFCRDYLI